MPTGKLIPFPSRHLREPISETSPPAAAPAVDGVADFDVFIDDVLDSVRLAMEERGMHEHDIEIVLTTVSDYIDNHYG